MGFKDAKKKVLDALETRAFSHEAREAIEVKNLLHMGTITPEEVIKLIKSSSGTDHSSSAHHAIKGVEVHVIKCKKWYIKFYFVDPDTVFISVHQ
ncbi:hypothetical protein CR152_14210 [Massilia violaceinigra]|uniref:Uncharacterized protein n=1 Tax=Massilia violaceinigra TaxID=2045208 RepID=A0A2D2DKS0_9BURK|nr:hypothetical protein [Massilia violaceinigra]ATQ75545.1 hypothetical protein CR152_14210 [Massilia violaceinigra]